MAKLPCFPIYKHGAEIVGAGVVFHYGDNYCADATCGHDVGRRFE
jgi:hypothetical protein